MQTEPNVAPRANADWLASRESVRVVVIYDDTDSRHRACRVESRLGRVLDGEFSCLFSWWHLRFLPEPRIMQLASESLHTADIVLFSLGPQGKLPLIVMKWIETELGECAASPCGLVALLETGPVRDSTPSAAQSFLSEVAHQAGWDFMSDGEKEGTTPTKIRSLRPEYDAVLRPAIVA